MCKVVPSARSMRPKQQAGSAGAKVVTYKVTKVDGKVESKKAIASTVTQAPVAAVKNWQLAQTLPGLCAGLLVLLTIFVRPFRTSWLIVGTGKKLHAAALQQPKTGPAHGIRA